MDTKYDAKFIDLHNVEITLGKEDVRKVEHLYFYVFNNDVLEEVVTSNKRSLKNDRVTFEINIKNPTATTKGYKILLSRNTIQEIKSNDVINKGIDVHEDELYDEIKNFYLGNTNIKIVDIMKTFNIGFTRAHKIYESIIVDLKKD